MTNADPEAVLTASADGVVVEKSFEPDDFPVPAIAFVVRSDREETVSVRLVDGVPEDVAPENIGFHPKYGAEYWDVEGESIVFEREFAPGEEYTTVYGLRGGEADAAAKFMSDPSVESVTTVEPADGVVAPDGPREAANGNGTDRTNADETPILSGEADVLDIGDAVPGNGADAAGTPDSDSGDSAGDGHEPTDGDRSGRVLDSLAAELEAADPDDPALATLREELGIDLTRASVEARIEHLQSTVSDLEAYTDALESFLDENGDAQSVLEGLREDYEETADRLESVESTAEEAKTEAADVDERLETELGDLRESVSEDVDDRIDALETELNAVDAEIESLSAELEDVVEMRNRLADALAGLGGVPDDGSDAEAADA